MTIAGAATIDVASLAPVTTTTSFLNFCMMNGVGSSILWLSFSSSCIIEYLPEFISRSKSIGSCLKFGEDGDVSSPLNSSLNSSVFNLSSSGISSRDPDVGHKSPPRLASYFPVNPLPWSKKRSNQLGNHLKPFESVILREVVYNL